MANEKRLIDFEKARKSVMEILAGKVTTPTAVKVSLAMQEAIVDAVEVVHGRWEETPDEYGICATEFVCSVCKESYCTSEMTDEQFVALMKYCPNCGAKMDGDGNG